MNLVRWNPAGNMFRFRNRFSHMFDDAFYPFHREDSAMSMWDWNPAVDIFENDDSIVIQAELPGVEKKDIVLDVKDRVLTLKGERSSDHEVKEDNYSRRERTFGRFERHFTMPGHVDPDKIKADYKDGILKIDIPKPEQHKPKKITVH